MTNNITFNVPTNTATTAMIAKLNNATLTPEQRDFFATLPVCPVAELAAEKFANEAALWVTKMPSELPEGVKPGFIWMDGHTDNDATVDKWRATWRNLYGAEENNAKADYPEFHKTIIFGHNPTAFDAKAEIVAATPREPFVFDTIQALGPAGKEALWAARTHDAGCTSWLTAARENKHLNTNHKEFVGGWPVAGGDFGTVIPHGTLVRNLANLDVSSPPELGCLTDAPFRFTYVVEWVNLKVGDLKIKLAQFYPLPPVA